MILLSANFMVLLVALAAHAAPSQTWAGAWAASQQLPEPQNSLAPEDLKDATLRQIVHLSLGNEGGRGAMLRVHLSNAFGLSPLRLTSVHIARPFSTSSARIDSSTDQALLFSGQPSVTIPAGAEYLSDPLAYPVAAFADLAITMHFDQPPDRQTGHPGSRATSYIVHGDLVSAADLPDAKKVEHWYQIAAVDVARSGAAASIVVLGDSITDGHGATTNGNDRWTDVLARRLQGSPSTSARGVLNEGTGGNHLLTDGLGPNALARLDRDVFAQAGVRYLIVLEGVNDLGGLTRTAEATQADHAALVQHLLAAYEQIIERAHTHSIKVIGATVLPYTGSGYYHPGPANEADRQTVNQWIRAPGHFDAVVDFDKITRDAAHPERLLPAFDCGDHLHPSPAGYAAMAEAIPLGLFGGVR